MLKTNLTFLGFEVFIIYFYDGASLFSRARSVNLGDLKNYH